MRLIKNETSYYIVDIINGYSHNYILVYLDSSNKLISLYDVENNHGAISSVASLFTSGMTLEQVEEIKYNTQADASFTSEMTKLAVKMAMTQAMNSENNEVVYENAAKEIFPLMVMGRSEVVTPTNQDIAYGIKAVGVIGYTNAGKSTFINKMIKNYGNGEGYITTSNLPSTTLNLIEAKVNDKLTLIDSPGLLDYGNIILNSGKSDLNKIIPKKEIRPISFQIKDKQYLYVENFLRLDLENTNIIIYMSNNLEYKRLYKNKECTLKKYDLKIKSNQDLVIKGLGFITFKKTSNFTLWLKEDVEYLIKDSII